MSTEWVLDISLPEAPGLLGLLCNLVLARSHDQQSEPWRPAAAAAPRSHKVTAGWLAGGSTGVHGARRPDRLPARRGLEARGPRRGPPRAPRTLDAYRGVRPALGAAWRQRRPGRTVPEIKDQHDAYGQTVVTVFLRIPSLHAQRPSPSETDPCRARLRSGKRAAINKTNRMGRRRLLDSEGLTPFRTGPAFPRRKWEVSTGRAGRGRPLCPAKPRPRLTRAARARG